MRRAILGSIVAMAAAAGAGAQDSATQGAMALQAKPAGLTPVRQLALAMETADYARAAKDPLALIVAASLRKGVATRAAGLAPDGETTADTSADPYAADALLAEAVALSKNDPVVAGFAEDARAAAAKGRSDGVAVSRSVARPGGTDWYRRIRYDAGKYAEAAVELLGGGAIDLFVYDSAGNVVCRDVRQPKKGYCGWTPKPGETFDIKVENRQPAPARYVLSTN